MLIGVAVLGGCSGISRSEQARYRGAAIGAFGFLAACPVEEPSDPDSDGKCINCNGTGKIGDGRIVKKCSICNGTGKSNTVGALTSPSNDGDSNHEQLVRTITIFSRPGCGKCDQWLASEAPKWESTRLRSDRSKAAGQRSCSIFFDSGRFKEIASNVGIPLGNIQPLEKNP
jgi:hypothetical protein